MNQTTLHRPCISQIAARLYVLPILILMIWDFVPRFFQGDSVSYLSTQIGKWVPPDRSWEFGLFVNFLLRHTHGLSAFMLLQIGALVVLVEGMRILCPRGRSGLVAWGLAGLLVALDPLIEIYTRFYMSDFLAMAFFLVAIGGIVLALRPDVRGVGAWLAAALILFGILGAVFFRVAYAPIGLLSAVFAAVLMVRRLTRRHGMVLALAAIMPILAVGAVAGANRLMFAHRFPNQVFVTKLSGVFLAGVFAPALTEADFHHAGIPITHPEFEKLDLSDYGKRVIQVWGHDHSDLQQLIRDNLHITGDYASAIDKAASRLVMSALKRDPLAFAKVYLVGLVDFAKPAEWQRQVPGEMGLTRTLPAYFITTVNRYSVLKITPDITTIRSALIRAYKAVAWLYPFQLLLGFLAGVFLLIRLGPKPEVAVPFAAFCADVASAPLYENYLIARYILVAIFLGYVLFATGLIALLALRENQPPG